MSFRIRSRTPIRIAGMPTLPRPNKTPKKLTYLLPGAAKVPKESKAIRTRRMQLYTARAMRKAGIPTGMANRKQITCESEAKPVLRNDVDLAMSHVTAGWFADSVQRHCMMKAVESLLKETIDNM